MKIATLLGDFDGVVLKITLKGDSSYFDLVLFHGIFVKEIVLIKQRIIF